jgi:hypothetical protein
MGPIIIRGVQPDTGGPLRGCPQIVRNVAGGGQGVIKLLQQALDGRVEPILKFEIKRQGKGVRGTSQ